MFNNLVKSSKQSQQYIKYMNTYLTKYSKQGFQLRTYAEVNPFNDATAGSYNTKTWG